MEFTEMMPLIHKSKREFSVLHVRKKGTRRHRSTPESFRPSALDRKKNDILKENRLEGIKKGCWVRTLFLGVIPKAVIPTSKDGNIQEIN